MPHNLEAEQAVICCAIINDVAAMSILQEIGAADFYSPSHRAIFEACENVSRQGKPLDFVTLCAELERLGAMEKVGGIEYVTSLANFLASSINFKAYVDIVKKHSVARALINACNEIAEHVYSAEDYSNCISFAEGKILEISKRRERSTLEHFSKASAEAIARWEAVYKDKDALRGLRTGFHKLDDLLNGLQKGDLIIVAARPSVGKTAFAMNIIANAALDYGAKTAVFSLEMPATQLAQRVLASRALIDMGKANKGRLGDGRGNAGDDWAKIFAAQRSIEGGSIYVADSSLITPPEILSKCRRLKREKGLDLIMIDYLQLMLSDRARGFSNRQQELSEMSRSLKIIARELDVPVIVLSQLNRALETRTDKRPVLSDLRESGAIEQDADIVAFLHRQALYETDKIKQEQMANEAELIIRKHRNGELGTIHLEWQGKFVKYKERDVKFDIPASILQE
ncbi:MAG: replicative DNA helicase [Firmicutes bacterium]|nr:replicative DNA helicase [Bacillota bacterium]